MADQTTKIRAAIFGGSGYGGSELLRILLFHPDVEIAFVTAGEQVGKKVSQVHRNLHGLTELAFITSPEDLGKLTDIDVAFFALPHGQAFDMIPKLPADVKAIDLSGDFRLDSPEEFERFYKLPHAGDIQSQFVYGQTETNRDQIASTRLIANPGCFATATILALAPILNSGLTNGRFIVDAKTGSSGSGVKPAANTHHPQRVNSFYAYKPFDHQHVPEIRQHLTKCTGTEPDLTFMTHSLPVSRGIFASCYMETNVLLTNEDIRNLYSKFYENSFFVRLVEGSPDINWVKNTNFCDIAYHTQGNKVVVFSAIDNLVKGAAGQAVQNMNLMFAKNENTGLVFTGSNP